MNTDVAGQAANLFNTYVIPLGWKIAGAIAVWIVGGWVIRLVRAGIGRTLLSQKVDHTLAGYIAGPGSGEARFMPYPWVSSPERVRATIPRWRISGEQHPH